MQGEIELRHNLSREYSCYDQRIHFVTIAEVDAYLKKQHHLRFTEGYFNIVRCRADQEDSIQDLIDAYDKRASAIERAGRNWSEANETLQASKDWLAFYFAVKADHPDVVEQYNKHVDAVTDLTERIELLKAEYQQLVGE